MKSETKHWLKIAAGDYDMSLYGLKAAHYPQAIYLLCQAIEKALKGAQIEFTNAVPRKTHRLETIAMKTKLNFSDQQYEHLIELTKHYGKVRYPDYAQADYNTKNKVESIFSKGKKLYLWILTKFNHH